MSTPERPRTVAVVGPTAAGKSDLAVDVALALGGEVVNTDAMQVYVGMDIGTAKLSIIERRGVRHHLLDLWHPRRSVSVAEFQQLARAAIADCHQRGVVPVLVGGSALYTRAVLDHFDFPGTDAVLRGRLESELVESGPGALHARLAGVDPVAASLILPSNGRRIVRALEVVTLTGGPYAASLPERAYVDPATLQLGVDVPREVLDERISLRVQRMWDDGLVEEVRTLEADGLREGVTASRALGYAQVLSMLAGEGTEARALEDTITATRRFVRRQHSWFGKDERISWLPYDDPDLVQRAVALVS